MRHSHTVAAARPRTRASALSAALWILAAVVALPETAAAATIDELQWLTGCWALDGRETGSGETWTSAAGGTMLGTSRLVRNGRTVQWEFMRIVQSDDGGIEYIASPSGQATTIFRLLTLNDRKVVFENAAHDFPQRVVYERHSGERLVAHIEGTIDGNERRMDFPMTRTTCSQTGG